MAFGIIRGPVADKIPQRSRHKTSRNAAKNINIFFDIVNTICKYENCWLVAGGWLAGYVIVYWIGIQGRFGTI